MNRVEVALTMGIILLSLGVIFLVSQWELPQGPVSPDAQLPEWVLLQPLKCTEIPWRAEWARTSGQPYASFPVAQEMSILTHYYQGKGIAVLDARLTYQATDSLCTQCGCPEPFVFGVQTYSGDAAKLAASGFKIVDTSNPYIFTGPLFRQSTAQPISAVHESDCASIFATQTILDEWLGSKKDSCYIQAAIDAKDLSICAKITASGPQTTCVTEVATATHNPSACATLASSGGKDTCYTQVAGVTQNAGLCNNVMDATAKSICLLGVQQN